LPIGDRSPIVAPTVDVRRGEVCALSGMKPGAACVHRTTEWLPDDVRLDTCTWHRTTADGVATIWPAIYGAWASHGMAVAADVSPLSTDMGPSPARRPPAAEPAGFEIVSPLAGATFLRDPTLRPDFQALTLRARGADGRIDWRVDGTAVGNAGSGEGVRWPLVAGEHEIEARDAVGRVARAKIVVR
jgi:membrane carboxypeptidase/penicillin-binding protein PbpC